MEIEQIKGAEDPIGVLGRCWFPGETPYPEGCILSGESPQNPY